MTTGDKQFDELSEAMQEALELCNKATEQVNTVCGNVQKHLMLVAMLWGEPAQDMECPTCHSVWSEREVMAMVKRGAGDCMCGNWAYDLRESVVEVETSSLVKP